MMSTTTIVLRRSNRSAKAPASGPSTIAGSSRKSSTPPRAKLAAANPLDQGGRGRGDRQQAEPVAEARQRHRQPQLAEVADPQHRPQLGDQADGTQRDGGLLVRLRPSGRARSAPARLRRPGVPAGAVRPPPVSVRHQAGSAPPAEGGAGVGARKSRSPGVGDAVERSLGGLTVPGRYDGSDEFMPDVPGFGRAVAGACCRRCC